MTTGNAGTDLRTVTVGDVMSTDPLVLRDDMRVEVAAAMLADHGYAGAPVVDQRGRLAGVLHALDVALAHLPPAVTRVRPVVVGSLLRPPVTVEPTDPIHAAAERMRSESTDRLVVVERHVRVVGLVTGQDLLRTVSLHGDLLRRTVHESASPPSGSPTWWRTWPRLVRSSCPARSTRPRHVTGSCRRSAPSEG